MGRDIKPATVGFFGFTSGVTKDLEMVTIVRFRSGEAAGADSAAPAQSTWFAESSPAFDGAVTFHDCADVDVIFGGGSDRAGYVQVMQGTAREQAAMRGQRRSSRRCATSAGSARVDDRVARRRGLHEVVVLHVGGRGSGQRGDVRGL